MLYRDIENSILMSIRPKHAQEIYASKKKFEFRKIFPASTPKYVFLIETNGIRKLTGYFQVECAHKDSIPNLWKLVNGSGVDRNRFRLYFVNWDKGHAIKIKRPTRLRTGLDVSQLRLVDPTFRVPQTFLRLSKNPNLARAILEHIVKDQTGKPDFALRRLQVSEFEAFKKLAVNVIGQYYDDITDDFAQKLVDCTVQGVDPYGYFTESKTVYSIVYRGTNIGFTTLTVKHGNAVKTGPTILLDQFRGKGIGTRFRSFLDSYLQFEGIRKVYCTCPDRDARTIRYLLKSHYTVEAHCPNQYSQAHGELVFGKLLHSHPHRTLSWSRRRRRLDTVKHVTIATKTFDRYFRSAFSKYYFPVDNPFVEHLACASSEMASGDMFYQKQKIVYVACEGSHPHSLVVLSPKRGGTVKITFILKNASLERNRELFLTVEDETKKSVMSVRKMLTSFPLHDELAYRVFRSMDYVPEGVLKEPYRDGIDFIQMGKFL